MEHISLTWNGHSCFTVEAEGYRIVLDPYGPGVVPGLSPLALTADLVLCSHEHDDHGFRGAVSLRDGGPKNPFSVTVLDTFHDDQGGALRGANRIHILEAGGIRAAHLGDLGCVPTGDQIAALSGLDAVMIPVGGCYTIDARQARELVRLLKPRVVLPMHYRTERFGYPVLGLLEEYTDLCDDAAFYSFSSIAITPDMKPQTAVLSCF